MCLSARVVALVVLLCCSCVVAVVRRTGVMSRGRGARMSYAPCGEDKALSRGSGECDLERDLLWGVFIDGRDSKAGRYAYGEYYQELVEAALMGVYSIPASDDLLPVFLKIKSLIDIDWRQYDNPIQNGVKKCHEEAFPQNYTASIMRDVVVVDEAYQPIEAPADYVPSLQSLFANYSAKLGQSPSNTLRHLAWLLQNLAFLHPLLDRNGRSRMLLLQYELRRHDIGRGSFMYNNNKDIYFNPLDVVVSKLEEGVSMYAVASSSGENPWRDDSYRRHHESLFRGPHAEALKTCWDRTCGGWSSCIGTSPELL
jgi:hypothetical protein